MNATDNDNQIFLTTGNKVFVCYIFCVCSLSLKMLNTAMFIGFYRMKNKVTPASLTVGAISHIRQENSVNLGSSLLRSMAKISTLGSIIGRIGQVFINSDDAKFFKGEVGSSDTLNRLIRAHGNDLENIPPFFIVALTYIFTNPPCWLAFILFITFTITRILHTIVYATNLLPPPVRSILWATGAATTVFMAMRTAVFSIRLLI